MRTSAPDNVDSVPVPIDSMDRIVGVARSLGEIDLDDLHREVREAGGNSVWWGVLQAEADAGVARATLALKTIEAETAKAYRTQQLRLDQKCTEAMVSEHLTLDADVRNAKEAVIEAERRAAIVRAASMAVNQKARTIQNLAFLIGQEHGARTSPLRERVRDELRDEARKLPAKREPV